MNRGGKRTLYLFADREQRLCIIFRYHYPRWIRVCCRNEALVRLLSLMQSFHREGSEDGDTLFG